MNAKNVKANVPNTNEKVTESIFGMKIVIESSKGLSRSFAVNAADGRPKMSFTRIDQIGTA